MCAYPVPCVHTAPGLLAAVLHLLELADGHGAEGEHLQTSVRAGSRRPGPLTYAEHDSVREEGFEGHTHGCGARGGWCAVWCGVGVVRVQLGVGLGVSQRLGRGREAWHSDLSQLRRQLFGRRQLPVHALSSSQTIICGVARPCRLPRIAKTRVFEPRPAANIARRARHRSTATSSAPTTVPHRLPELWGPAQPPSNSETRSTYITHFTGHNDALRRLHDALAPAPAPALHASTAEVSAARTTDAVEGTSIPHSDRGVSGFQAGDCCVLRNGGARSAHRPDRDQRRPRRR